MAVLLSKRGREDEPLQTSSPKRFRSEEQILCLLQEGESCQAKNCRYLDGRGNSSEEIDNAVDGRRTIEEEIVNFVEGRTNIEEELENIVDGRINIEEELENVVDGRINIEEEIENVVDGRINIEEEIENFVDGRINIEEEIENVVDGRSDFEEQIDEVVNGVMRSLEQEIGLACSSSDLEGSSGSSVLTTDKLMADDMNNSCGIDVEYLLGASDNELGLPPSPLLDSGTQPASPSLDQSFLDFPQNGELKSFLENWHFEDDFVDYRHFSEDAETIPWDIFSPGAFIDGDYSVAPPTGAIY